MKIEKKNYIDIINNNIRILTNLNAIKILIWSALIDFQFLDEVDYDEIKKILKAAPIKCLYGFYSCLS